MSRKSKPDVEPAESATPPDAADASAPAKAPKRAAVGLNASLTVDGRKVGTRALVLVPQPPRGKRFEDNRRKPTDATTPPPPLHSAEDRLAEAAGLAEAIDLVVVDALIVPLPAPRPATLFGTGKVEEIRARVDEDEITLVVVDHQLTPIQQRNLEKAWNAKVLDRTGLILEIFGRRAQTREGRLQVELAHLSYQKSRLVRAWTHLERQRGGAGFLGGPGESQLELDRRIIQERIDGLKKELVEVVRTRELGRAGRRKVPYKIVAIVGYTNAGKSTLFNRITGANVLAQDQVFATLDPTLREVKVAPGRKIILSDTVGFISDLPTMLVAAFRATLEEVIEAALVLHVRDIAHPETNAQAADVRAVLADLGVDPTSATTPLLEVWNKIDCLDDDQRAAVMFDAERLDPPPVLVSAVTGEGIGDLLSVINARVGAEDAHLTISVPPSAGRLIHWLHEHTEVVSRATRDDGQVAFSVRVSPEKRGRLEHQVKQAGALLQGV